MHGDAVLAFSTSRHHGCSTRAMLLLLSPEFHLLDMPTPCRRPVDGSWPVTSRTALTFFVSMLGCRARSGRARMTGSSGQEGKQRRRKAGQYCTAKRGGKARGGHGQRASQQGSCPDRPGPATASPGREVVRCESAPTVRLARSLPDEPWAAKGTQSATVPRPRNQRGGLLPA